MTQDNSQSPRRATTVNLLFSVLRSALWDDRLAQPLSGDEFLAVMALAEQQTVQALAFDVLSVQRTDADRKQVLRYANKLSKIQRMNLVADAALQAFVRQLACRQAAYLVMKGQTLAALYPHPQLRVPGDIDFILNATYPSARRLMLDAFQVALPEKLTKKEYSFKMNGMVYDFHSQLFFFASSRNARLWAQLMEEAWQQPAVVRVGDGDVCTLPPTMNAVYLFLHLFFHLIREGVAIKQFCDCAVFLHAHRHDIDRQRLQLILRQLRMEHAFAVVGAVLVDCLGLPLASFPMTIGADAGKWRDKMVADIVRGGSFGKQYHHAKRSLLFKTETLLIALRNSWRYYRLAPDEAGMLVPRLLKANLRNLLK